MQDYLRRLLERQLAMQEGIFTHPPSDWSEFQKRLGRWCELDDLINDIEGKIKESTE